MIYERNGKLFAYQKSAIEKILNKIGARVGFHFSNHDLENVRSNDVPGRSVDRAHS